MGWASGLPFGGFGASYDVAAQAGVAAGEEHKCFAHCLNMACLEYIHFKPWREVIGNPRQDWIEDEEAPSIKRLPQIFWENGEGWAEANHWALDKATGQDVDPETVKALMKHLHAYANFLEMRGLDWRHFPMVVAQRAIVQFRGELIGQIKRGTLASSTARSRMGAVIQFYRHADRHNFIGPESPMWRERVVVVRYYDAVGFKRVMSRASTDLTIPNRTVEGVRLEEGLLPLSEEHLTQLLEFTAAKETREMHLMLSTGFFTGARLGTITTLRVDNLEHARPDPYMKGFLLIRVGPGTRVETKFSVSGDLLVPDVLLNELKAYASSSGRLKREARAKPSDRSLLFLTKRGCGYQGSSISRLMTDLRRNACHAGLKFMVRFKFHQTRATYGTWLMKLALDVATPAAALEFVKGVMLHKHESTTFTYIKFLEVTKGKQEAARAFNQVFTGICNRNWGRFDT